MATPVMMTADAEDADRIVSAGTGEFATVAGGLIRLDQVS
jgi:hypothetical protein